MGRYVQIGHRLGFGGSRDRQDTEGPWRQCTEPNVPLFVEMEEKDTWLCW